MASATKFIPSKGAGYDRLGKVVEGAIDPRKEGKPFFVIVYVSATVTAIDSLYYERSEAENDAQHLASSSPTHTLAICECVSLAKMRAAEIVPLKG